MEVLQGDSRRLAAEAIEQSVGATSPVGRGAPAPLRSPARRADPASFDLLVTETIGRQGFDESIVPTVIDARRRFLREGATIVPRTIALRAAPVRMDWLAAPIPAGLSNGAPLVAPPSGGRSNHGLRLGVLESLLLEVPIAPPERERFALLARPVSLIEVDLATVQRPPRLHNLTASWRLNDTRRLNGIALWVEAGIAPGVRLSTRSDTHWAPTLFPLAPFRARRGTLEASISLPPRPTCWTASLHANGRVERQSRGPLFAYLAMTRNRSHNAP
ncbi:MAG: hypothetical protein HYY93_16760 [Planctomycetes bacterium]|nr:hypothetical protein [Planctomycetota bacterium]